MLETLPILVAIPDEWRNQICQHLESQGYSVIPVSSQDEAIKIVKSGKGLFGVIIVSDWAMSQEATDNVVKLLQEKVPTITVITEKTRRESGYLYMDEVFFPPKHEYISAPFSLEELEGRMRKIGMTKT